MPITLDPLLAGNADPDVVAALNDLVTQMNAELDALAQAGGGDGIGPEREALETVILDLEALMATKRATFTVTEAQAFYDALGLWVSQQPNGTRGA